MGSVKKAKNARAKRKKIQDARAYRRQLLEEAAKSVADLPPEEQEELLKAAQQEQNVPQEDPQEQNVPQEDPKEQDAPKEEPKEPDAPKEEPKENGVKDEEVKKEAVVPQQPVVQPQPDVQPADPVKKTLTDFFNEEIGVVDLDELAKAGFIRNVSGGLIQPDANKNAEQLISELIKKDGAVYVQAPVSGEVDKIRIFEGKVSVEPQKFNLIDPIHRKEIQDALRDIQADLIKTDNPGKDPQEYNALRDSLSAYIALTEVNPGAFNIDDVRALADRADKCYIGMVGKRKTPAVSTRMDRVRDLKDLCKAIENDRSPKDYLLTDVEKLRREAAEKFVKEYAVRRGKLKNNPEAAAESREILTSYGGFDKWVDAAMEQPYFNNLYAGTDAETLANLEKMRTESSSAVFKEVLSEFKEPKERKRELAAIMKAVPPTRKETYDKKSELTMEAAGEMKLLILSVKEGLDALGNEGRTSPEFQKLSLELKAAAIRLNSGSNYIDYRRMAAELGDAADKYFNAKIGDFMNDRREERVIAAGMLRHMADAVNSGESPQKTMPARDALLKEIVASKVVKSQAESLLRSKDALSQIQGKRLLVNPDNFKKKTADVLGSKAFENLVKGKDESSLKSLMSETSDFISKNLSAEAVKLQPKVKVKAPEKQPVVKDPKVPSFALG